MTDRARSFVARAWLWLPPIVYAALMFHFSSLSDPLPAVTSIVWDKALHALEYAGLGGLLCRAFLGERFSPRAAVACALLAAVAYAASDEWHQWFVPGRDSSVADWVADATGAALGTAGYGQVASFLRARW